MPLEVDPSPLTAASLLGAPAPEQRPRRTNGPRVSIGTIEVTVTAVPAAPTSTSTPTPPVPGPAPAAAGPAAARPVREQLRLGERRWYGMAQA